MSTLFSSPSFLVPHTPKNDRFAEVEENVHNLLMEIKYSIHPACHSGPMVASGGMPMKKDIFLSCFPYALPSNRPIIEVIPINERYKTVKRIYTYKVTKIEELSFLFGELVFNQIQNWFRLFLGSCLNHSCGKKYCGI